MRFASSWTLVNAHEVAIMAGLAAAVDLGAEYPEDLENDKFALLSFRCYYLLVYGKWYRKRKVVKGAKESEAALSLSVLGCVVNGTGEARETDIGITGGGAGTEVVAVRVLTARPGRPPAVVSFDSKLGKGRLARALLLAERPARTVDDVVAAWSGAGGRDATYVASRLDLLL